MKLELPAWPGAGEPGAWGSCCASPSIPALPLPPSPLLFLPLVLPFSPSLSLCLLSLLVFVLLSALLLDPTPSPSPFPAPSPPPAPPPDPPSPVPATGASARQRLGAWAGQASSTARATLRTCLAQGQEVIEVGGARAADWEPPAPAASFRQTSRWQVSMGTKSHLRSEAAPLSLTGTSLR